MKFPDFVNEISKELSTRLSRKLSCNWLIILVTMVTPISSHVRDKNSIFTVCDEDINFYKRLKRRTYINFILQKLENQIVIKVCKKTDQSKSIAFVCYVIVNNKYLQFHSKACGSGHLTDPNFLAPNHQAYNNLMLLVPYL